MQVVSRYPSRSVGSRPAAVKRAFWKREWLAKNCAWVKCRLCVTAVYLMNPSSLLELPKLVPMTIELNSSFDFIYIPSGFFTILSRHIKSSSSWLLSVFDNKVVYCYTWIFKLEIQITLLFPLRRRLFSSITFF